jgi:hypothetical protein
MTNSIITCYTYFTTFFPNEILKLVNTLYAHLFVYETQDLAYIKFISLHSSHLVCDDQSSNLTFKICNLQITVIN